MKVVTMEEAKANLDRYAEDGREGPVIVSKDGKPIFELIPIRDDEHDFMDRLMGQNAGFRSLLEQRREEAAGGRVSRLEEVRARLFGRVDTERK